MKFVWKKEFYYTIFAAKGDYNYSSHLASL